MDNLEYIEAYFSNELSVESKREFEQKIITDPMFAEEVSFFIAVRQEAVEEVRKQRDRFRKIYQDNSQPNRESSGRQPTLLRRLLPWAAIAAVLAGIVFSWNLWFKPISPQRLADKYITENFQILPVKMGNSEDSVQAGLKLYNAGRLEEALLQFESMLVRDTSVFEAKKYAGIVYLRLEEYDKAIKYFSQVENTQLYANPGKFYHALTLLKRNRPGDQQAAKILLEQVVQSDQQGKEIAQQWLKNW